MPVLGVTGGIATGKSVAVSILEEILDAEVFDADRYVRHLLSKDGSVIDEVIDLIGEGSLAEDGSIDRAIVREKVFRDPDLKKSLESILHPRVRAKWTARSSLFRLNAPSNSHARWLLLEIPLLYETGAELEMDRVVVTACSAEAQRDRLSRRPGITSETASLIVSSQAPQRLKIGLADHLIWTDCEPLLGRLQTQYLAKHLLNSHG